MNALNNARNPAISMCYKEQSTDKTNSSLTEHVSKKDGRLLWIHVFLANNLKKQLKSCYISSCKRQCSFIPTAAR